MTNLIKIGTFSMLSQLPVKTLHHYDEIGLLRPSHVDKFTSYRYYTFDQLKQAQRILALKDLGLSLEQIVKIIHENPSAEVLIAMLDLRKAQLASEVQERIAQLTRIEARLRQLLEEDMSDYDLVVKTVQPMLVASVRLIVPKNDEVPDMLGTAYQQIKKHIEKHAGKISGPCLTVWRTPATQYENEDVEAAFPLAGPIPSDGQVQVHELPATRVASVIHRGKFEDFTQGHAHILKWAEENSCRVDDEYREIYVQHDPGGTSITEIQFKIEQG